MECCQFEIHDHLGGHVRVRHDEGWSPQLAIKFLSAHGLTALRYSPIGGDEWHGSSPMVELGKPETLWRNNLAYYVGGSIDAATQLTLKLGQR